LDELDDEEWGWGDEDGNDEDIELTPSYTHDTNLTNRRPSGDNHKLTKISPKRPSPNVTRSSAAAPNLEMPTMPSIQTTAANSGAPTTGVVSGTTATSMMYPSPASTGSPAGTTIPSASNRPAVVPAPAPVSAGAPALSTKVTGQTLDSLADSNPLPMRITSLGKKKPVTSQSKKPAAPPPEEDDIFASMGLSAKPKFSHVPVPASKPDSAVSSSRWAKTSPAITTSASSKPPTITYSSTLGASPSSATSSAFNTAAVEGGDDDADWGDDADLDDLLDD